jgi:hypothetical protein
LLNSKLKKYFEKTSYFKRYIILKWNCAVARAVRWQAILPYILIFDPKFYFSQLKFKWFFEKKFRCFKWVLDFNLIFTTIVIVPAMKKFIQKRAFIWGSCGEVGSLPWTWSPQNCIGASDAPGFENSNRYNRGACTCTRPRFWCMRTHSLCPFALHFCLWIAPLETIRRTKYCITRKIKLFCLPRCWKGSTTLIIGCHRSNKSQLSILLVQLS